MVWSFVSEFQTLIAAAIGFFGVGVAIYYNGKQQREARKAELAHRARTIKRAIRAELTSMGSILKKASESFGDLGDGDVLVPKQRLDHVYQSVLGDIPSLNEQDVEKILGVYGSYSAYFDSLHLFSKGHEHNYLVFSSDSGEIIKKMSVNMAEQATGLAEQLSENPVKSTEFK